MSNKAYLETVKLYNKYILAISSFFTIALPLLLNLHMQNIMIKLSLTAFILTLIFTLSELYFNAKNIYFAEKKILYKQLIDIFEISGYLAILIALVFMLIFFILIK